MRFPRIKIPPAIGQGDYHCRSKTISGEWLFDDPAKEVLRRQLWLVADFCGVEVLTYTILSNHFHIVVRVPPRAPVSDQELLRRYKLLHPRPTKWSPMRVEMIADDLKKNTPRGEAWRKQQLLLMGDVSQYMKLLKQRFSIWFNRTHDRYGPLWCDRFSSNLIGPGALGTVMAYIDLNCVRANMVADPKDYRFCGYAEAVAGNPRARRGFTAVFGSAWVKTQCYYRLALFGIGSVPRNDGASISPNRVAAVLAAGGTLPVSTLLRCRLNFITGGAILGTREFIAAHTPPNLRRAHALKVAPRWGDGDEFVVLRAVCGPMIG